MYGKIVNGELQAPPVEISRNIQKMLDAGFKPVMDNKPAHDINTQDAVFSEYIDRGIYIDVIYEVVDIEPTEEELMVEQTNKVMEMLNINIDDAHILSKYDNAVFVFLSPNDLSELESELINLKRGL